MFRTRLVSGIFLAILTLFLIITGGSVLLLAVGIVSLIGLYELFRVFHIEKTVLGLIGYLSVIFYYSNLYFKFMEDGFFMAVLLVLAVMTIYVITYPKFHTEQIMAAFFCVIYVAVMISYVYQTRQLEQGAFLVFLIFISSWGCDTCAYCVGMLIGKHKLAPVLSPKKSIEGAIGGVVGAAFFTLVYGLIIRNYVALTIEFMGMMVLIGTIGAVISQIGDLSASAIKRNYEIKDYGKLIPGHGGIMDRFDSVFFTAPFVYYLSILLIK
ncbi:MAG: phosphatidate cytidylyltransferase [Lachnospiraceae bacterium]